MERGRAFRVSCVSFPAQTMALGREVSGRWLGGEIKRLAAMMTIGSYHETSALFAHATIGLRPPAFLIPRQLAAGQAPRSAREQLSLATSSPLTTCHGSAELNGSDKRGGDQCRARGKSKQLFVAGGGLCLCFARTPKGKLHTHAIADISNQTDDSANN